LPIETPEAPVAAHAPRKTDDAPMTARPAPPDRRTAIVTLVIAAAFLGGFALLSQYSYATPEAKGLGAALSVGPIAAIGIFLAWRWTPRLIAALLTLGIGVLLVIYWPLLKTHYEWSDLIQQVGAYAMVATGFGRSLLPGRTPLCTQLASQIHGPQTAVELRYTRRATWVWFAFYTLLAVAIVIVFFRASPRAWSLFTNFGSFGLMAALFLADHGLRRLVLPRRPGGGIVAALLHSVTGSGQR
jgi:uncharacterized membrane protein